MSEHRPHFATRLGVIAATVGSAVGLGNIWRFPYEAGNHGGGAFMLCYILFVVLLGVPTICAEFALGRGSHRGLPGAFRWGSKSKKWDILGYAGIISAFMIISFYSVVAGWTLQYISDSASGFFQSADEATIHTHFTNFIGGGGAVAWTVVFLLLNAAVMIGGVQKGIERVSNILMPLMFVIIVAFVINSLCLPEARHGLEFLFKPDFSKLTPSVIIGAMGQAFFSLSLGLGCMVTYASYFPDNTPIIKSSFQIAFLDTLVAVLSGIIVFPAVFSFGLSPTEGPTLVFEVFPNIFHSMPGGRIWSILFFVLLAVASITSVISMSEIAMAFLCDMKKMSRKTATLIITGICIITASLCSLSFGPFAKLNLFNIFNNVSSNILIPLGGMGICLFVGWKLKKSVLEEQWLGKTKVPRWLFNFIFVCVRYIAPAGILAVFISGLFEINW